MADVIGVQPKNPFGVQPNNPLGQKSSKKGSRKGISGRKTAPSAAARSFVAQPPNKRSALLQVIKELVARQRSKKSQLSSKAAQPINVAVAAPPVNAVEKTETQKRIDALQSELTKLGDGSIKKVKDLAITLLWLDVGYKQAKKSPKDGKIVYTIAIALPPHSPIKATLEKQKLFQLLEGITTKAEVMAKLKEVREQVEKQITAIQEEQKLQSAIKAQIEEKRRQKRDAAAIEQYNITRDGAMKLIGELVGADAKLTYIRGKPYLESAFYMHMQTGAVFTAVSMTGELVNAATQAVKKLDIHCINIKGESITSADKKSTAFCDAVTDGNNIIQVAAMTPADIANLRKIPHTMGDQIRALLKHASAPPAAQVAAVIKLPDQFDYNYAPWMINPAKPNDTLWINREELYEKVKAATAALEADKAKPEYSKQANIVADKKSSPAAKADAKQIQQKMIEPAVAEIQQLLTKLPYYEDLIMFSEQLLYFIHLPDKYLTEIMKKLSPEINSALTVNANDLLKDQPLPKKIFSIRQILTTLYKQFSGHKNDVNQEVYPAIKTVQTEIIRLDHYDTLYDHLCKLCDRLHDMPTAEAMNLRELTKLHFIEANKDWCLNEFRKALDAGYERIEKYLGTVGDQVKLRNLFIEFSDTYHKILCTSPINDLWDGKKKAGKEWPISEKPFQHPDKTGIYPPLKDTLVAVGDSSNPSDMKKMAQEICNRKITDIFTESTDGKQKALLAQLYILCGIQPVETIGAAGELDAGGGFGAKVHREYVVGVAKAQGQEEPASKKAAEHGSPLTLEWESLLPSKVGVESRADIIPPFNHLKELPNVEFASCDAHTTFTAGDYSCDGGTFGRWVGLDKGYPGGARKCIVTTRVKWEHKNVKTPEEIFRVYADESGRWGTGALNKLVEMVGWPYMRGVEGAISNSSLEFCHPRTRNVFTTADLKQKMHRAQTLIGISTSLTENERSELNALNHFVEAILSWKTSTDAWQFNTIRVANDQLRTLLFMGRVRLIMPTASDLIGAMQNALMGTGLYLSGSKGTLSVYSPSTVNEDAITAAELIPRIRAAYVYKEWLKDKTTSGAEAYCENIATFTNNYLDFVLNDTENAALYIAARYALTFLENYVKVKIASLIRALEINTAINAQQVPLSFLTLLDKATGCFSATRQFQADYATLLKLIARFNSLPYASIDVLKQKEGTAIMPRNGGSRKPGASRRQSKRSAVLPKRSIVLSKRSAAPLKSAKKRSVAPLKSAKAKAPLPASSENENESDSDNENVPAKRRRLNNSTNNNNNNSNENDSENESGKLPPPKKSTHKTAKKNPTPVAETVGTFKRKRNSEEAKLPAKKRTQPINSPYLIVYAILLESAISIYCQITHENDKHTIGLFLASALLTSNSKITRDAKILVPIIENVIKYIEEHTEDEAAAKRVPFLTNRFKVDIIIDILYETINKLGYIAKLITKEFNSYNTLYNLFEMTSRQAGYSFMPNKNNNAPFDAPVAPPVPALLEPALPEPAPPALAPQALLVQAPQVPPILPMVGIKTSGGVDNESVSVGSSGRENAGGGKNSTESSKETSQHNSASAKPNSNSGGARQWQTYRQRKQKSRRHK